MPCYDGRDRPEEVRKDAFDEFRHNSPVAEMLCAVVKTLLAEGRPVPDVPDLATWWLEHRARDNQKTAGTREFFDGLFRARVAIISGIQYQFANSGEYLIEVELLQDAGRVPPIGPQHYRPPYAGARVITTDRWLEPVARPLHGL